MTHPNLTPAEVQSDLGSRAVPCGAPSAGQGLAERLSRVHDTLVYFGGLMDPTGERFLFNTFAELTTIDDTLAWLAKPATSDESGTGRLGNQNPPPLPLDTGKLRELLAKATPGEWLTKRLPVGDWWIGLSNGSYLAAVWEDGMVEQAKADAALIVAMHEALPLLLDKAEEAGRLEAERDEAVSDAMRALTKGVFDQRRAEAAEAQAQALREALKAIAVEAEREQGKWLHLKRVIALNARSALLSALAGEEGEKTDER